MAARPSKSTSKEASTLELNPMTGEQRSSERHWQGNTLRSEPLVPLQEPRWTVTENSRRIRVPAGSATPSAEERALHEASGRVPHRSWCQWCIAARAAAKPHLRGQQPETMKPCQELSLTLRISVERRIKRLQSMSVPRSLSAILWPTKASSESLEETILVFA